MKLRTSFYIILVFTMTAFVWWTYSLIKLSYEVHVDDNDVMEFEAYQARRVVLLNSKFKQDDDTVFAALKLGNHAIYFDTVKMRQKLAEEFPHTRLSYDSAKVTLTPEPDIILQLQEDKVRRVRMYIIEGVVFLILLMVGFSWIYNRLNTIIRLNQQKSNFLLAVTHELKTPMASVKLFLQTIQRRDLTREQMNPMIENCIEDVDRLNDLAENMLLATRIEGKSYQYNFVPLDFTTLLTGISESYIKKHNKNYRFIEEIEDNIEIEADIFSLTLAINNLIENAIKYSTPQSVITLGLYKESDRAILTISDEGPGIPKDERAHIFTKFYRIGNESTRTTKGTGLGLFIVKQITDGHKATIEVLDNKPVGSIFKLSFKLITSNQKA